MKNMSKIMGGGGEGLDCERGRGVKIVGGEGRRIVRGGEELR